MASDPESDTYENYPVAGSRPNGWLKVGAIAAASVLVGGVSVAWWYRKTLGKLRQTEDSALNTQFGISSDDSAEDD